MIEFVCVRFKNFGSFGNNFSEIKLNTNKTTLVTGVNGHGKSFALLDTLCFGLFGKPFRPINIPQLINSVNGKNCVVEIEFNRSGSKYLLRRGLSPKIFEIYKDGELIDQHAKSKDYQEHFEENILGFNYAAFKQVVILGKSNFVPFMQLTPAERRKIIEGLLDLDVLADMNQYVKGQLSSLKGDISENESLVKIAHEKIKAQKSFIDQVKTHNAGDIKAIDEKIESFQANITLSKSERAEHVKEIEKINAEIKKHKKIIDSLKDVPVMLTKAEVLETALKEEIESLKVSAVCNCCGQDLPKDQREKHLAEKEAKLVECQKAIKIAKEKNQQLQNVQDDYNAYIERRDTVSDDIMGMDYRIGNGEENVKRLLNEKKDKVAASNIVSLEESLKESESHKDDLSKKLQSLINEQIHHDIVYDILKDGGLKSRIIKHYVPIINGLVNKFLGKLNLYVDFNINEEFKETIRSRYRDEFSYSSFSEGEKQRIDLAILLTWREIAKMKNSLNCNLLIFDEILDSSLDTVGTESFIKLLNKMKNKCSIYIISHKSDQLADKFDQQMHFEKKNNFSKIKVNI
jgi:DNA repair exonuclease SbcCD ATPase subunit